MRSLWQRLFARNAERGDARPAALGLRPQFEALERRENPAGQADALVWGNSWEHFQVGSNNRLMVNYSSNGGRVQTVDLSTALNSTTAFNNGAAALAATTFANNPYVFVAADSGALHTFYWTGGRWAEANLSAAAGYTTVDVRPNQIAAQVWNGIPHVFFVGYDNRVHELYWSAATGWRGVDLTAASGTSARPSSNDVIAAVVAGDGTERVYYQASDNHLRELRWSSAAGWVDSDVSGAGQTMYSNTYELSAYALGNAVYVAYQGADRHVYRLANTSGGWTSTDLNAVVGVGTTRTMTDMQAYYANGAHNVVYIDGNGAVSQFSWRASTGWTNTNLTFTTYAYVVPPSSTGKVVHLQINSTQTLFYHDTGGRICRMFSWDPLIGWQNVEGWQF